MTARNHYADASHLRVYGGDDPDPYQDQMDDDSETQMPTAKIVEIQDCEGNQAWQIAAYFDACLTWFEPAGTIYYSREDAVSSAVEFGYEVV